MLTIPFDGPDMVGRRVVLHTTAGLRRGVLRFIGPSGLDLLVDSRHGEPRMRRFRPSEIRVLALA